MQGELLEKRGATVFVDGAVMGGEERGVTGGSFDRGSLLQTGH